MTLPKPPRMEVHRIDGQPLSPQVKETLERLINPLPSEEWERIWSQWHDFALYGSTTRAVRE